MLLDLLDGPAGLDHVGGLEEGHLVPIEVLDTVRGLGSQRAEEVEELVPIGRACLVVLLIEALLEGPPDSVLGLGDRIDPEVLRPDLVHVLGLLVEVEVARAPCKWPKSFFFP